MSRRDPRRGNDPSGSDTRLKVIFSAVLAAWLFTAVLMVSWMAAEKLSGRDGTLPTRNPLTFAVLVLKNRIEFPALAWIFTVIVVAVGITLAGACWTLLRGTGAPQIDGALPYLADRYDRSSCSKKEVAKTAARLFGDDPEHPGVKQPGVFLGVHPKNSKEGYWADWESSILLIYGPRFGKTSALVIPTILDAPGHVMTTSNKRDIVDTTLPWTSARGDVWIFDPDRICPGDNGKPMQNWYFDPLDMVRLDPERMDGAAGKLAGIFATANGAGSSDGGNQFFQSRGIELLGYLFLAAACSRRPVGDVNRWINDPNDMTAVKILKEYGWRIAAANLQGLFMVTETTKSGIFAVASSMLGPLGRESELRWVTPRAGARRFDPDEFVRAQGQQTLYLLAKQPGEGVTRSSTASALTTALAAAVFQAAERYGEEHGGRLPIPFVAALDEAANTVRWDDLPGLYSHYGSRSIFLLTILQSYSQGESVWGERGMKSMYSAAGSFVFGGSVRDEDGLLPKLEALVGDVQEVVRSTSRSRGVVTVSNQVVDRRIITVAELGAMPRGRALIFSAGRRPILYKTVLWTKPDRYGMRRYDPKHPGQYRVP